MIQVASCEQALIKTNRKLIRNHQSKKCFFSNVHIVLECDFDRHLEHMFRCHGMQSGLPVFLVVNSALPRFLCKMTVLQSSRCSKWPNNQMVAVVKHCWLACTRKKRLQRKMTKDYYWIDVQENIGMFSKS